MDKRDQRNQGEHGSGMKNPDHGTAVERKVSRADAKLKKTQGPDHKPWEGKEK